MGDTVWDTTDTDTVWDTVATTDTDIPVLTVMPTTTLARGLLMPNLKLKPHPRPMLKPLLTMVDTTVMVDTAVDTDTWILWSWIRLWWIRPWIRIRLWQIETVLDWNILPFL